MHAGLAGGLYRVSWGFLPFQGGTTLGLLIGCVHTLQYGVGLLLLIGHHTLDHLPITMLVMGSGQSSFCLPGTWRIPMNLQRLATVALSFKNTLKK